MISVAMNQASSPTTINIALRAYAVKGITNAVRPSGGPLKSGDEIEKRHHQICDCATLI
jgi:hypothetical protein